VGAFSLHVRFDFKIVLVVIVLLKLLIFYAIVSLYNYQFVNCFRPQSRGDPALSFFSTSLHR